MGWDEDDALIAVCRRESELWHSDPAILRARAEADVAREERAGGARRAEIGRLERVLAEEQAQGMAVRSSAPHALPPGPRGRRVRVDARVAELAALPYGCTRPS